MPGVVLVEITKVPILSWYRHAVEIVLVANGLYESWKVSSEGCPHAILSIYLEVTTDDEEIEVRNSPLSGLTFRLQICVDSIEASVSLRSIRVSLKADKNLMLSRGELTQPTTAIRGERNCSILLCGLG